MVEGFLRGCADFMVAQHYPWQTCKVSLPRKGPFTRENRTQLCPVASVELL